MRILILGVTGLLGHRLFIELSKHHEVWGTTRSGTIPSFADRDQIVTYINASMARPIEEAIEDINPAVVINCIADIRYRPDYRYSQRIMVNTNSLFPLDLADYCGDNNRRLIHFSTDGVFSGKRGNYTEDDTPDATDVYGMTKRLGEISDQKHVLTLRCCPIGRELGTKKSLVEWFLAQTGTVKGYAMAQFSPLTTHEIARVINDYVLPRPDLYAIYHIGKPMTDKFAVLDMLTRAYQRDDIQLELDTNDKPNRWLNTSRFDTATGYTPPTWNSMIEEMVADNALYEGEHAHG